MNTSFPVFEKYSYIPIIAGPTASGKSALALEICKIADGELVCADSMQIYKGLISERRKIPRKRSVISRII